jgi:signal transduction histidine kinase
LEQNELTIQRDRYLKIGLIISLVSIIVIGLLLSNRMKNKQNLAIEQANTLAREAQISAVISSQEKERNRFARDLHDTFGQLISVLNLNLDSLRESKPTPQQRDLVFQASANVLQDMYAELKNVCFDLMPQSLIKGGIQPALVEFAHRINTSGKIFVETDFFGLEQRLIELEEISIYRISQEWINNVMKYSNAEKITLQLTRDESETTLLIEDNGTGFNPAKLEQGKGNGWKNIQSRANLIKGTILLDTVENRKGNTLILNVPVKEKSIEAEKYPIDGILR